MTYDFKKIEAKWQKKWEDKKIFAAKNFGKKKFYCLEMYPYPSGTGLHIGHAFNYTIGDIYARFKRMQGFNVLHPMGYDSFGLPAENAAIKFKSHPRKFTDDAIKMFIKQQKMLGLSYDWKRLLMSHDENYYKWNQWFFLKMFEKGLAYKKKAPVNFCSKCDTVLANEQVHNGKCWRHTDTEVEIKNLEQWFLKITDYAEELLREIDNLDWPERIKTMQRNWIGKSEGAEINFEISNDNNKVSNVVIVHGCPTNKEKAADPAKRTYDKHWIPWLKEQLEKRGIKTDVPLMSAPWEPDYDSWKEEFNKLNINEKTVLVAHSCGGGFLVRWIDEERIKVKKLILVSPGKSGKARNEFKSNLYGNKTIKNIGKYVKEGIVIFTSNNDIEGHIEAAYEYEKELPAKVIFLRNRGHFLEKEMGTKQFPELLNQIIPNSTWKVFTTRADTLFGVTFLVISAQHSELTDIVTNEKRKDVEKFLKKIKSTKQEEIDKLDKEGVFTGSYAVHPSTGEKIPVWVGNFVVAEYGSGIVMAVPAHDARDFEFAKKYNLPIKQVIGCPNEHDWNKGPYVDEGNLVNSKEFNDLFSEEAKEHIVKALELKKLGKKTIQYKLRDWLISRQRYWGTPIPILYDKNGNIFSVEEKELPVKLPDDVTFGNGNPLKTSKTFANVKKNGKIYRRETDTMDTFFDSSWYFLRFTDAGNKKKPFDSKNANYWMPVDFYTGGAEHACMHLIYARFFTKMLGELGMIDKKINEPFKRLFNQGMVHGEDGFVMSKSRGNVIDPLDMVEKHGADSLRMFMVSVASPDSDYSWKSTGLESMHKFLMKTFLSLEKIKTGKSDDKTKHKINKGIKEVSEEIENLRYNLAIIKIRALFEYVFENEISKDDLKSCIKLLSPFAPHVAEEFWEKIGGKGFVSSAEWPKCDEKKINRKFEEEEKNMESFISDVLNVARIIKERQKAWPLANSPASSLIKGKETKKLFVYVLPKDLEAFEKNFDEITKRTGFETKIFAVNDNKKYDPENKSKKAKPGRPAIYLE